MTSHEPDEPRNDLREEVSLWKRREHRDADVQIMYDTKSRCEFATNLLCISQIHLLFLIANFNLARLQGRQWHSYKERECRWVY